MLFRSDTCCSWHTKQKHCRSFGAQQLTALIKEHRISAGYAKANKGSPQSFSPLRLPPCLLPPQRLHGFRSVLARTPPINWLLLTTNAQSTVASCKVMCDSVPCVAKGSIRFAISEHLRLAIHRLSPDVAGLIADHMDLPSLLAWRSSCSINYAHATAALKRTVTSMINPFLTQPLVLLNIISRYGAVIGGEFALAFIRRHQPFQPRTLEIFASAALYQPLCIELLSHPQIIPDVTGTTSSPTQHPYDLQRDILETRKVFVCNSRTIYIHCSSTLSPLSPIARSLCTALTNFVTPHSFGCAYPRLTLADKSLSSDLRQVTMVDLDVRVMQTLVEQQIDSAVDPADWQQYRIWSPIPAPTGNSKACWRSHYICPEQGRFFGDRGSLVDFVDPLGTPTRILRERGSPPFGTTVIWRLSSSYECPLACEARDNALPLGQTSTAIIMMDDPFRTNHRRRSHRKSGSRWNRDRNGSDRVRRARSASL